MIIYNINNRMNKKYLKTLIVILIICGLSAMGYFYFSKIQTTNHVVINQSDVKSINTNTAINANTNTTQPVRTKEEVIDTSEWKTYKSEEYGFEFKYPKEFKLDSFKDQDVIGLDPGLPKGIILYGDERDMATYDLKPQFAITITNINEKITDLKQWSTTNYPSDYIKKYIKIGNNVFLNLEPSAMVDSEEFLLYKNNTIYEFYLAAFPTNTKDQNYNKLVNYGFMEIIKSFTFH